MLVKDILFCETNSDNTELSIVSNKCRQFIDESQGYPLLKNLPTTFKDVHRVKVRKQKKKTQVTESFNKAFENEYTDLRQRALFVYGSTNIPLEENQELFYIFPVDGYRYMYNTEVANSNDEYKAAFDTILEQFSNNDAADQIVVDLLQYTYTCTDLVEGLKQGAEIIIYNVPSYYAIRTTLIENYTDLLTFFE